MVSWWSVLLLLAAVTSPVTLALPVAPDDDTEESHTEDSLVEQLHQTQGKVAKLEEEVALLNASVARNTAFVDGVFVYLSLLPGPSTGLGSESQSRSRSHSSDSDSSSSGSSTGRSGSHFSNSRSDSGSSSPDSSPDYSLPLEPGSIPLDGESFLEGTPSLPGNRRRPSGDYNPAAGYFRGEQALAAGNNEQTGNLDTPGQQEQQRQQWTSNPDRPYIEPMMVSNDGYKVQASHVNKRSVPSSGCSNCNNPPVRPSGCTKCGVSSGAGHEKLNIQANINEGFSDKQKFSSQGSHHSHPVPQPPVIIPVPQPHPHPWPQAKPWPLPIPDPHPKPWPIPKPDPHPEPWPFPETQPEPWPVPEDLPHPQPWPVPKPRPLPPLPETIPFSDHVPETHPEPWDLHPKPFPRPQPLPHPQPGPDFMPQPMPFPHPWNSPQPHPLPHDPLPEPHLPKPSLPLPHPLLHGSIIPVGHPGTLPHLPPHPHPDSVPLPGIQLPKPLNLPQLPPFQPKPSGHAVPLPQVPQYPRPDPQPGVQVPKPNPLPLPPSLPQPPTPHVFKGVGVPHSPSPSLPRLPSSSVFKGAGVYFPQPPASSSSVFKGFGVGAGMWAKRVSSPNYRFSDSDESREYDLDDDSDEKFGGDRGDIGDAKKWSRGPFAYAGMGIVRPPPRLPQGSVGVVPNLPQKNRGYTPHLKPNTPGMDFNFNTATGQTGPIHPVPAYTNYAGQGINNAGSQEGVNQINNLGQASNPGYISGGRLNNGFSDNGVGQAVATSDERYIDTQPPQGFFGAGAGVADGGDASLPLAPSLPADVIGLNQGQVGGQLGSSSAAADEFRDAFHSYPGPQDAAEGRAAVRKDGYMFNDKNGGNARGDSSAQTGDSSSSPADSFYQSSVLLNNFDRDAALPNDLLSPPGQNDQQRSMAKNIADSYEEKDNSQTSGGYQNNVGTRQANGKFTSSTDNSQYNRDMSSSEIEDFLKDDDNSSKFGRIQKRSVQQQQPDANNGDQPDGVDDVDLPLNANELGRNVLDGDDADT